MEEKTIERFHEKYTVQKNHLDKNASEDRCMYETNGPEYDYIYELYKINPQRVWTVIDNNDGWYGVVAGWHWINRMGYMITKEKWNDETEEYTIYDNSEIREMWEKLPDIAISEIIHIPVEQIDEDIRDEEFYIWEEMSEEQREEYCQKYKYDMKND